MTEREHERETDAEVRFGTGTLEEETRPEAEPAAPKPPPASWGPWNDGPGSPAGSVRPPDTTGTVEATGERAHRGRPGTLAILVAALVGAVLGTAATIALTWTGVDVAAPDIRAPIVDGPTDPSAADIPGVAAAVTPSVVRIEAVGARGSGLGSGVIYSSDGLILTNNHVIEHADNLEVIFVNGERTEARVVGTDPLTDLAVLRVERTGLPAINVRDDPVAVGETAVAIGAPFGLNASVTAGIVSGVDRSLEVPLDEGGFISIPNIIQTDAAINPGNSGGALVDRNGRLIGINTAILATVRAGEMPGFQGVGFAISARDAISIADELIAHGLVRHARLGIQGGTITPRDAEQLGVEATEGVYVDRLQDGGPAEEAGVQPGDIIIRAAGERVTRMDELVAIIRQHGPGDTMTVTVLRNGQEMDIDVVLGAWD
jgi:S1-C subfamily serine protease